MKIFIVFTTCIVASLASGWEGAQFPVSHENIKYDGRYGYAYPKIGHDGVPIDTPEVQHARATHLSILSQARASHVGWNSEDGSHSGQHGYASSYGYDNNLHYDGRYGYAYPKIGHNGVPIDTPEVQNARTAHLNALSKAQSAHAEWTGNDVSHSERDGDLSSYTHDNNHYYDGRYGYAYPKIGPNGVPIDTPEVQHARAFHLSVLAQAKASHAGWNGDDGSYGGQHGYASSYSHGNDLSYDGRYGYAYPKIGHDGVPIDTPEVQHARSAHLIALSKAQALHAGWSGDDGSYGKQHEGSNLYGHDSNLHYDGRYGYAYPKIGHNGVPIDTPEVQHARAAHLSILSQAQASHAGWAPENNGHYRRRRSSDVGHSFNPEAYTYPDFAHDGQPIETPAVQALKHAHFAAHSEALSRVASSKNNDWNNEEYNSGAWNNEENNGWNNAGYASSSSYANINQQSEGHGVSGWNNAETGLSSNYGHSKYQGPIHIPKIGHNGVPEDTPEVQYARHQHLSKLAEEYSRAPAYHEPQHQKW